MDFPVSIPACVLVIEDALLERKMAPLLEHVDDVIVLSADNGPEAMAILRGNPAALVLLDLDNPGVNGFALADMIRSTRTTREVPMMFVGAAHRKFAFESEALQGVEFLAKPVDMQVLCNKVGAFVDLYRQRLDIASQIEKLDQLAQFNARVVSALSHDIRTPLSVLRLSAELVLRRTEEPAVRQAAERIKVAASALAHQVSHLVNIARSPKLNLHPQCERFDLSELVEQRMGDGADQFILGTELSCACDGDSWCHADRDLIATAIDQLLLVVATYGTGAPVRAHVGGQSPRALTLRIATPSILPETARHYLFGTGLPDPHVGASSIGVALDEPDRIARAHGGSLIGESREREGTFFEMMLPRRLS